MYDTIQELALDAAIELRGGHFTQVALRLAQIQGLCDAAMVEASMWDLIRQDYEAGIRPKQLAARYDVKAKQITDRAYREQWLNQKRKDRMMRPPSKAKLTYPKCKECTNEFEAKGYAAAICPTCKAAKRRKTGEWKRERGLS